LKWIDSTRFLTRLNAPPSQADRARVELVLGTSRAVLALLSAVAVYIDPTEPVQYTRIAHWIMMSWAVYSVVVVMMLRYYRLPRYMPWVLHGLDILWPAVISIFTQGPNSPFIAYFIFALAAAGFRWGLPETMGTAVVGIGLLDLEAVVLTGGPPAWELTLKGTFDVNGLIIRCSYLLILGVLIGYFGEMEKERRAESTVLNRILRSIRADQGFGVSLHLAVNEYLSIYGAERAYLVMEDLSRQRVFLWQAGRDSLPEAQLFAKEISPVDSSAHLGHNFPETYFTRDTDYGVQMMVLEGEDLREVDGQEFPDLSFHQGKVRSVLSTSYQLGQDWYARLYLVNANLGNSREQEALFAERVFVQVTPALYSVFLVRRLRRRIGAIERARVARELHDGAIQSLISAEMQMDVLRRRAERESQPMSADLAHIQSLLQREVLNLRELMQQMKPLELSPEQFLDYIADQVDRFRRDTGISAQFTSELQDIALSPHSCRELVRIVQEALVNVRKHSSARHVLVRFGREDSFWKLTVDDDGKGFGFDGTLTNQELMNSTKGPAIIKERVRNIGGELIIESRSGEGARLEITIPQKGNIIHG
jgi:signal transduction histidine kinase